MSRLTNHEPALSRIRTGCAGWSIPANDREAFGDGPSALARYATRFSFAEINSSFYRPHRPGTYARWAATVQGDFRFAVKMPKSISHEARLQAAGPLLDRFIDEVSHLQHHLGVLLLQLPPSLAFDARTAATFFAMLRRRTITPVVCEPRHASWFATEADALLQRHGVARVAADPTRHPGGDHPGGADGVRYWRWHGSPRMYYSAYTDAALSTLATEVHAAHRAGTTCWVVFDNTAHGAATANALRLQALLEANRAPARQPSHLDGLRKPA